MSFRFFYKNNTIYKKYSNLTALDKFIFQGGILTILYFVLRFIIKNVPFIKPVFIFFKKIMIWILLHSSYFICMLFGEDVKVYQNIIYIEGSAGVKIINACLGWSMIALYAGFILIYPGEKKAKYWYIPLGIGILVIFNILRITAMVFISHYAYDFLQIYHQYIFKIVLFLVVFALWIIWVKRYGVKRK